MSRGRRALATVDLGAVERNCGRLAAVASGAELCAVVKADGYGHGALACARAALAGGASRLAVASAEEAASLRAELSGVPLLVMGALSADELELALEADAEVAVWRRGFLDLAAELGRTRGAPARVHVKYDTGMGRLGERDPDLVAELVRAAAREDGAEVAGLWTHLATADEPSSAFLGEQLARFERLALPLKEEHPELVLHAANSAATLREPKSHFDMVRCGIAIYGLDPFHEDPRAHDLEPALALRSYVADVKRFEAGASAGYGRTWRAPSERWVGVLPIGYGDGIRRGLGNNGQVLVGNRRREIVGTVSMDNLTVDLGPQTEVSAGAEAVLIGAQGEERILCEQVASRLGTINYEVTCGISARVPRVHTR